MQTHGGGDSRSLIAVALRRVHAGLAQDAYPTRPIRMIVAYPPGGGTDIVGRVMAQKLTEQLGQNVVVDNRGGATGNIGTEIAARAAPDGYTLLMGNVAPNAINVSLFKKLPYDPVKDFAPVSLVAVTPNMLVVHPSLPVKTVKELIALAKAKPGALNFPSAGIGSSSHLAGELLEVDGRHRHGARAVQGRRARRWSTLLSGQMQIMFATMPAAMPHVKSGQAAAGRRDHREALAGAARTADDRRIRRAGLRSVDLVRPAGAGAHAAADRRRGCMAEIVKMLAGARTARAPGGAGFRAGRRHAGRVRRLHQVRNREVGAK